MKRIILILLLLILIISLTGCWRYGKGQTVGYIYAVDDGIIFWDKVWYKSSLDSSESDCYLINNDSLKKQLTEITGKQKVKIYYDRHYFTLANCIDQALTNDEIISFEVIKE